MLRNIAVGLFAVLSIGSLNAQVRITEWMYDGSEFVEFTNLGALPQDLTGWSFQDNGTDLPTPFSLTPLGTLAAGESAIVSQSDAATFRTLWNLGAEVKVLSYGSGILQRSDTINLFNTSGLEDQLAYGDNTIGGIRTNTASGWTTVANLGTNNVMAWQLSVVGDAQNSYLSTSSLIANPGTYVVPEPSTVVLIGIGLGAFLFFGRRRFSR